MQFVVIVLSHRYGSFFINEIATEKQVLKSRGQNNKDKEKIKEMNSFKILNE